MNSNLITTPETNGNIPSLTTANAIDWIFMTIQPYISGRTLEIGSGTSTFSPLFIEKGIPLHLSDADQENTRTLRDIHKDNRIIRAVHSLDLRNPDFQNTYPRLLGAFGCIFKLSNSAPGAIDPMIITTSRFLLEDRGRLILLTSAHISSYFPLTERDLKKYNQNAVQAMLGNGYEIITTKYFNLRETMDRLIPNHTGLTTIIIARKI